VTLNYIDYTCHLGPTSLARVYVCSSVYTTPQKYSTYSICLLGRRRKYSNRSSRWSIIQAVCRDPVSSWSHLPHDDAGAWTRRPSGRRSSTRWLKRANRRGHQRWSGRSSLVALGGATRQAVSRLLDHDQPSVGSARRRRLPSQSVSVYVLSTWRVVCARRRRPSSAV